MNEEASDNDREFFLRHLVRHYEARLEMARTDAEHAERLRAKYAAELAAIAPEPQP